MPLSDGSGDVKIRGLSLDEAFQVRQAPDTPAQNALILRFGLVDPAMSEEDIAAWTAVPGQAGVLSDLAERISHESGMTADSGKAATKSPRRRS